ncbi:MAG: ArsR family transcriptional regulator [Lentimicrobiaceae bacterium]|nr:ArsR family transcriptional regulator [Lentimicrobiaceae bacterium]MCB9023269.1 ArsR family transcriptional regulator [Lentimicrobiaceae bacterium]MCO5267204.1 ArsR family transcriptional regulator [Lentimicrobium sp.]
MDIAEQILKALTDAGKPMKAGEIAESTGIDKKEVDNAIKKLKKEDKLSSPKVCYYEPKK